MTHFNIAKKVEVNPFENVQFVRLSDHSQAINILKPFLDLVSEEVVTKKIDNTWVILYHLNALNFTTVVTWFEPFRGKFWFKNSYVHFKIVENTMHCW